MAFAPFDMAAIQSSLLDKTTTGAPAESGPKTFSAEAKVLPLCDITVRVVRISRSENNPRLSA